MNIPEVQENIEILKEDGHSKVYRLADRSGEIVVTVYRVFPGIELLYYDVHTQDGTLNIPERGNFIEIYHCREGRIEFEYGESFCHLAHGDFAVIRNAEVGKGFYYPLSHYHGISVRVDLDHAPRCLSCMMEDVDVRPSAIAEKFCGDNSCFIARSDKSIEHIFSELYRVPESIRRGYLKVKVLELFLFLSALPVDRDNHTEKTCSKNQALLAREVCKYLTEHMEDRITLDVLSKTFHTSGTNLKTAFKAVYGVSVYSYIRTQKMQAAALMLTHTDSTILEIAGRFGYDNPSKFASAFKDVIGMSPCEYRTQSTEE